MNPAWMQVAEKRMTGHELSRTRLRLAMRLLSQAADADVQLYATAHWMTAMRGVAKLLGEKCEIPFEVRATELRGVTPP